MSLLTRLRLVSRRLPVGPTVLHRLRRLAAIAFRLSAWWKHGRSRRPQTARPGPVCVVGFHGSVLGIGEAARALSSALRLAGADVVDWDISARFGHEVKLDCPASPEPPAQASAMILVLNPRELIQLVAMAGAAPFRNRFCVGAWAWELEQIPADWRAGFRYVDEAWLPSRFVAEAVATRAPVGFPIRVLPHPVQPSRPARKTFGLPDDKLVVLTVFDVRSGFERKNPIAAVRAFRRAEGGAGAVMLCKVAGAEGSPVQMAALMSEIGERGDVRVMTDWLSGADMASLLARADIVLSLHRSEGFGLVPAQAMAAGKAVVATGWSATTDFMSQRNSALVDYTLVPVKDPQGLYQGGRWAEADVDDAAAKLARLLGDPSAREALGRRAAEDARVAFDPLSLGRRARGWLGQDPTMQETNRAD